MVGSALRVGGPAGMALGALLGGMAGMAGTAVTEVMNNLDKNGGNLQQAIRGVNVRKVLVAGAMGALAASVPAFMPGTSGTVQALRLVNGATASVAAGIAQGALTRKPRRAKGRQRMGAMWSRRRHFIFLSTGYCQ